MLPLTFTPIIWDWKHSRVPDQSYCVSSRIWLFANSIFLAGLPNDFCPIMFCCSYIALFLGEKRKHLRHTFSISCKIGQKGPPSGGLPLPRNPRSVKCCFLHLFYDKIVDPMYRIQSSTVINKVSNSPVPQGKFHFTKTRAVTTSAFISTTPPPFFLPIYLLVIDFDCVWVLIWIALEALVMSLCLGPGLDYTRSRVLKTVYEGGFFTKWLIVLGEPRSTVIIM